MEPLENLVILVQRSAARLGVWHIELWEQVLSAILAGDLHVDCPERLPGPNGRDYRQWLAGIHTSVVHGVDPSTGSVARYLGMISVREKEFRRWRSSVWATRRGPRPETNSYRDADIKLCPEISSLIEAGKVRSARSAVFHIVRERGKKAIAGDGTLESLAKRISPVYRQYKEGGFGPGEPLKPSEKTPIP